MFEAAETVMIPDESTLTPVPATEDGFTLRSPLVGTTGSKFVPSAVNSCSEPRSASALQKKIGDDVDGTTAGDEAANDANSVVRAAASATGNGSRSDRDNLSNADRAGAAVDAGT
jgi:hypothetical protein